MIQVYSQEKRMEKISASQYYLSKDTYQGVHFEIKEEVHEEFDVFVRLHGACTVPDDSYAVINLTWPIQPEGLERIRPGYPPCPFCIRKGKLSDLHAIREPDIRRTLLPAPGYGRVPVPERGYDSIPYQRFRTCGFKRGVGSCPGTSH